MFQTSRKRTTLKQLVEKECILAPCVYDCMSSLAAEMCGYKALLLSGGEIAESVYGLPNLGMNTIDVVADITYRITSVCSLPVAVDMENGFGGPLAVFQNCDRLIRAGAMAIQLEDTSVEGENPILPRNEYLAKIKAAVSALQGTDCMLIARTDVNLSTDMDEAVARCLEAKEAGAEMVLCRCTNLQQAEEISKRIPGWKMFPDIHCKNGTPNVTLDQLSPLGFNFVTMHFFLKAAMNGMLHDGIENFKAQNNLYTSNQTVANVSGCSAMDYLSPQEFLDFEKQFTGISKKWSGPSPRKALVSK